jgi:outer membrane protein TolC
MRKLPILLFVMIFFVSCARYEKLDIAQIPNIDNNTKWYQDIQNNQLKKLYESADKQNYDLKILSESIKQSNLTISTTKANESISVDTSYSIQNKKDISNDSDDVNTHSLALSLDYKIDLFGKYKALSNQSQVNHQISILQKEETKSSLYLQITKLYYQIIEKTRLNRLLNEQIKIVSKIEKAIEYRLPSGDADISDMYDQQRAIKSLKATKLSNTKTLKSLQAELYNLTKLKLQIKESDPTIKSVKVDDIKAKLLQNRVDVKSAYLSIVANDYSYASSIYNQYPQIDLSVSLSSNSDVKEFFKDWFLTSLGKVAMPLFDASANENSAYIQKSKREQAMLTYMQTLENGIYSTKVALINLKYTKQRYKNLKEQMRLAKLSFDRITYKYDSGQASYLEALTSLNTYQTLQRELISLKRELIEAYLDIHYQTNTKIGNI